jgi:hypothetical protein
MQLLSKDRRSAAPMTAALLAVMAALCLLAVHAPRADAYVVWMGNQLVQPQQQLAGPTVTTMRSNRVWGTDWVGAAAHVSGSWTLYGAYVTGWNYACHTYAAGNTIGPMAMNVSGVLESMNAQYETSVIC